MTRASYRRYNPGFYAEPRRQKGRLLGASARRLGDAASDAAAVASTINAGDIYLQSLEYDNAVEAYKASGNAADTVAKRYSLSVPDLYTWNTALNAINSTPYNNVAATGQDAATAQSYAKNIYSELQQAISTPPLSTTDANLDRTASAVISYLQSRGCTQAYIQQVYDFQVAYNASGAKSISTDGKYGPQTQAALQAVTGAAPRNCFTSTAVTTPATTAPATQLPAAYASTMTPTKRALIIAAVVAAAGLVGLWAYKKAGGKRAMYPGRRRARRVTRRGRR